MGLFKRLMGRLGYVKLAEYGFELTADGIEPVACNDDIDGPYAVGSVVDVDPVPDSPVLRAIEQHLAQRPDLGEADTLRVIVEDDVEADTRKIKFLEADTIPAKKI